MTIDELEKTYWNAAQAHWFAHQDEKSANNMSRAGIRAVVTALREVICDNVYMTQECCGMGRASRDGLREECCGNPVHSITRDNLIQSINEILASDGVKAAR
jgi:D-mannonate dehydratase